MWSKIKVVVHDGTFHIDDIFAVAILSLALGKDLSALNVVRSRRQEEIDSADYVLDVGGIYDESKNKFDHHMPENLLLKRVSGIPYSTSGLLWKKFGTKICGSAFLAEFIDEKLIVSIDALDNGIALGKQISKIKDLYLYDFISAYKPVWGVKEEDRFLEIVGIIKDFLKRYIKREEGIFNSANYFRSIYEKTEDRRIIVLDIDCPWEEYADKYQDVYFIVYPASNGWGAKGMRSNENFFELKKRFPSEWAGLSGKELAKASGVKDAIFCHHTCFVARAESRDGAIALAKIALEK